jgi:hypothetical protein
MDDGKHDILPVAGAILDHARVPVMLPPPIRCRHAPRRIDDRSDGPQPAVDERGRVRGDPGLAGRNWIDRVVEQRAYSFA